MNYFFDTEFFENGPTNPIVLISIGIVAEDGREFYAENGDADLRLAVEGNPWLKDNVLPHLRKEFSRYETIGPAILKFIGMDTEPRFWAYFADYDWVVFCQLFGRMVDLPPSFPNLCRDLKQEMLKMGMSRPVIEGCGPAHNALSDARWGKALFGYMKTKGMIEF